MKKKIGGVIAAIPTPIRMVEDGQLSGPYRAEVHAEALERLVRRVVRVPDIGGVAVMASPASYATYLSVEERAKALKVVREHVRDSRLVTLAGLASGRGTGEALNEARMAASLGYDAVWVEPPSEAYVGAQEAAFHLYALLERTPPSLAAVAVLPRSESWYSPYATGVAAFPRVAALADDAADARRSSALRDYIRRSSTAEATLRPALLATSANSVVSAMLHGFDGLLSPAAALLPTELGVVQRLFMDGAFAWSLACQDALSPLLSSLEALGPPGYTALAKLVDPDAPEDAWIQPAAPFLPLSEEDRLSLEKDLHRSRELFAKVISQMGGTQFNLPNE